MPSHHWHIQEAGYVPDTFQSLTSKIPLNPKAFFDIGGDSFKKQDKRSDYLNDWKDLQERAALKINDFFPKLPFSELESVWRILQAIPDNVNLHLANSMPVRLVNLIGSLKPQIEVFSNRGVCGIDGCTSTAVGISMLSAKLNILITGDMAFFYDRNGLWHNNIPGNLRIIMLNNHGGGIFRLIDGPSNLPEMEEFFETNQKLTAKNSALDFGIEYHFCNDSESLIKNFKKVVEDDGKAKILEIESNSQFNKTIFDTYISQFK
jgi:2-succinyl-5-enolpyruvyl-6-hydroxy-3-cyclohexene-1-carboxylate synthase